MSTDTPRTDKEVHIAWECFAPTKYVPADFARQLERELAAAQQKVSEQGLTLACLCDGILGEDAADRSDATLVRVGCSMKRELAATIAERDKYHATLAGALFSGCFDKLTVRELREPGEKMQAELAALREENRTLREALNLALGIPTMTDEQLKELIKNCKAVAFRAKEAAP